MELLENIALWKERIAEASDGKCRICAVTKTRTAEEINGILAGGLDLIGENRVQELLSKQDALDERLHVHLIGSLQTNKVKQIVGRVEMIQSLDRIPLAREISKRSGEKGIVTDTLVQVNVAREPQKGGVLIEDLEALLTECSVLDGIRVRGLMGIMPAAEDPEEVRPYFRRLRALFEELRERDIPHVRMEELSMGMTHDALVAAQEGAGMVRLGRALFGARN